MKPLIASVMLSAPRAGNSAATTAPESAAVSIWPQPIRALATPACAGTGSSAAWVAAGLVRPRQKPVTTMNGTKVSSRSIPASRKAVAPRLATGASISPSASGRPAGTWRRARKLLNELPSRMPPEVSANRTPNSPTEAPIRPISTSGEVAMKANRLPEPSALTTA